MKQKGTSVADVPVLYVLIEIVSVSIPHSIPSDAGANNKGNLRNKPNLFVAISSEQDRLHQTSVIKKNNEPIYTCKTGSLFLLPFYDSDFQCVNQTNGNYVPSPLTAEQEITFEIFSKDYIKLKETLLSKVQIDKLTLLHGDESRQEVDLAVTTDVKVYRMKRSFTFSKHITQHSIGTLALRYRIAKEYEIDLMKEMIDLGKIHMGVPDSVMKTIVRKPQMFLGRASRKISLNLLPSFSVTESSDSVLSMSFDQRRNNTIILDRLKRKQRKVQGRMEYLVKPYPDPKNTNRTTWMTKDELDQRSLDPSTNWIEAIGDEQDLGELYFEVIRVSDMPNLDSGQLGDMTDCFICSVFEDNIVRTDVIYDELSPRFMPWTQRAFVFPIKNPSSLLFIGAFDYDVLGNHDPVGRVVVDMNNFHDNTVYLLDFKLHHSIYKDDDRGTIRIRLRIEWKDGVKHRVKIYSALPKIMINVPNDRSFKTVKYLCRGQIDFDRPSLQACKSYANEIMSYGDTFVFLLDNLASVLLWRGSLNTKIFNLSLSLWCPLDSILLFMTSIIAVENPVMLPSILCFSMAYIMFKIGYRASRHPYPWKRCKSPIPFVKARPVTYEEHQGYTNSLVLQNLDRMRLQRLRILLQAISFFYFTLRKEYAKLDYTYYLVPTEEKGHLKLNMTFFIENYVSTLQQGLQSMCCYLRIVRNIATWKSYNYSFVIMVRFFVIGIALALFPITFVFRWICRIVVFTFLGPWMKIIDLYFVQPFYPTSTDKRDLNEYQDFIFDKFYDATNVMNKLKHKIRLAEEEALKLKDMKEVRFGNFTEEVKVMDLERHASIPEPTSTARPFASDTASQEHGYRYIPMDSVRVKRWCGQRLYGSMIPHTKLEKETFRTAESDFSC